MKKLLPVFIGALFLLGCNKSSPSPSDATGTFSATINGTAETFNNGAVALETTSSGTYLLAIAGLQGKDTSSDKLAIAIASSSPIVAGNYSDAVLSNTQLTVIELQQAGGVLFTFDPTLPNAAQVTITSLTTTNIQGTFSGVLNVNNTSNTTATKVITNGKFNLALTQ